MVELLSAVVQRYSHPRVQQQPVAGKELKEASGRERKGSPRLEVEGAAKVQLITKLRDLLHDGLLRSSSSTTTTSTAFTERRSTHDGAAAAFVDEENRGSTGARLSRSLSLKRLTGGKSGSMRKSDEGGRMRMNRSHSLSRDSVVVSTSSPTSSSTIWRNDRDRGGEASSDAEHHQQRQRRSGSTGSGSGGSRRGSVGRNGEATRSNSISSEDQQHNGLGKESEHHLSEELDDELEHAAPVPGRTLDGADAELAESERRRSDSKREKKKKKTATKYSSKTEKLEKRSGGEKKKAKTTTTTKKKKDKKDKDKHASNKEKGKMAAEQESTEGEREDSTEQPGKEKRRGGSELRRSVSWYKETHNHRLDRIVASTNDKCAVASPPLLTSSSKKEKSRSLRNIFQLLTFSQEVKANSKISKQPVDGARPKRSPSDPSSSASGSGKDYLSSSGELSEASLASSRQHPRNGIDSARGPRRSGESKDPRLTVSAEELRGSGGSWASCARASARADDDSDSTVATIAEEEVDRNEIYEEEKEEENKDEDDDDRKETGKTRGPVSSDVTAMAPTSVREGREACGRKALGSGSSGGHNNNNNKSRERTKEEAGGDDACAEADGRKKRKKPKKKLRKSEAALERRLADIDRLRRLVDDLHVALAGHPLLPALGREQVGHITVHDHGIIEEAEEERKREEEDAMEWRANTQVVVGKVVEVMLQARGLFHSCPDELQRADILFMARQLNASVHRLADVLDSRPHCSSLGAFVQHRIELTAASLELVVACGLPEEWMRAYTEDAFLSDA